MLFIIRDVDNLIISSDGKTSDRSSQNITKFNKLGAKLYVNNSEEKNLIIEAVEYYRNKIISIDEFKNCLSTLKINSYDRERYDNFLVNGYVCNNCGLEGKYFWIERTRSLYSKWHMNLYGIKDGFEVMLTKDHIIPRSLGGPNHISNYQTLCKRCNQSKGNNLFPKEK